MRESLTVLAGLLVLALLAALIGPGFVDWRSYRPQFEARLTEALGFETSIDGDIQLRLLPSPRIGLGQVRIGDPRSGDSSVTIERTVVELALASLARGEFRFAQARLEGATVTLAANEDGAIRLPPQKAAGLPPQASLERLTISRSAVIWREPGRDPVTVVPIAAEVSAVTLAGPWRVEGEVAGTSFRVTTGEIEEGGRLRAKAFLTGDQMQFSFDGAVLLARRAETVGLEAEGGFTLAPGGAVSLAGRLKGGGRQLDLSGLTLDLAGGAARLEGEGQFLPAKGTGSLALRARRLDADALTQALADRKGFERALAGLPGRIDLGLDLDQLIWRGEDISALSLRGKLDDRGLEEANASARLAGALIGFTGWLDGDGGFGRVTVKAEDARRVALVLGRNGLDPALTELVAGLGRIDADALGRWSKAGLSFEKLLVAGSSGLRIEGAGELSPQRLAATATIGGLDLTTLPPGTSLAGLVGDREIALSLTLARARFRNAPPGQASLDLKREGASWRLSRLRVEGFGGVDVSGAGALLPEGGEIAGRIRAPRFETLAALAGPLLPPGVSEALSRAGDGLSRLDTAFRLTRAASGDTALVADGTAAAGKLAFDGRLDRDGSWQRARLNFDLGDRRQVFAALGLPVPQRGGTGRVSLDLGEGRLAGTLAGPGLSVAIEPDAAGAVLTVQADGPGQILPEGAARLVPDAVLDIRARLQTGAEAVRLDDLTLHLGAAKASGTLVLPREGRASGRLQLASADLRALVSAAFGPVPQTAGAIWSTGRFGRVAEWPDLDLGIEAETLVALDGVALQKARFTLRADADGLRIEDIAGGYGAGQVAGRMALRRDGGLAQLNGRLDLSSVDLAGLTRGALSGRLSGRIELGGAGESPARLIAGLSGAGSLALSDARLARFDPRAYERIIAGTGEDASESDAARLRDRLGDALDRDSWALGEVTLPFTLAAGIARLQPFGFERSGLRAEASGTVDLRALTADVRLALKPLGPLPKGWPGDAPQIAIAWRGPLNDLRRESDVSALSNTVAARALAREIERVEAFEADARERAMHARRLRAEREMRENERRLQEFLKAEEERRAAEQKRLDEAQRAEEQRRMAEQARAEAEARRRAEAEERARAATERAGGPPAQPPPSPTPQPQNEPLLLPGAPRTSAPEGTVQSPPAVPLSPQGPPIRQPLPLTPAPARPGVPLN
ncbi:AsmA family protein [Bosea sp. (in: a-proteobacteria)]|uniref:AsmA family protein n=1 Tax=Bosea sp. (in: a-proteobacteria) TaxID=1871050 RepID=UPI003B3BC316